MRHFATKCCVTFTLVFHHIHMRCITLFLSVVPCAQEMYRLVFKRPDAASPKCLPLQAHASKCCTACAQELHRVPKCCATHPSVSLDVPKFCTTQHIRCVVTLPSGCAHTRCPVAHYVLCRVHTRCTAVHPRNAPL